MATIQVQTVLYNNDKKSILRSLNSFKQATEFSTGTVERVCVRYGDSYTEPLFTVSEIEELNKGFADNFSVEYYFFDKNMGSAGGQNALSEYGDEEFLFIINPDIVVAKDIFLNLLAPFSDENTGITEAKQLPIEHAKVFDTKTGETSWASGACTFIRREIFNKVGKYDSDSFFMYCDDVDLSWRVRLLGLKVLFLPNALCFHDKTLAKDAAWQPSNAEMYYSAEAALLMAYKWSKNDILEKI